jgi:hypothetical protein
MSKCKFEGCTKYASFGYESDNKCIRCSLHKEPDMINIKSKNSKCEHGKRKSTCKECDGGSICEHKRIKSQCKECGGSSICEHKRQKSKCKECGGGSICEHKRQKSKCKECGGSSICEHKRIKSQCKECGGGSICEHKRIKSKCKECDGSSICEHKRIQSQCKECGGSSLCKTEWCEKRKIEKYNGYCLRCCIHMCPEIKVSRNYKTKELHVFDRIREHFPNFTWVNDKVVEDGCSKRRPDILLDMGEHILILEVDENKHSSYDCICENKRLMQISQDLQHRPIVWIRFNPDGYVNQEGINIRSCWKENKQGIMQIMTTKEKEWEERIEALKIQVQYWIDNKTTKTIEIIELFYGNS